MLKSKTNYSSNWIVAIASIILLVGLVDAAGFWLPFASDPGGALQALTNKKRVDFSDADEGGVEDISQSSETEIVLPDLSDSKAVESTLSLHVKFDDLPERFDFVSASPGAGNESKIYTRFVLRDRRTRTQFDLTVEPDGGSGPDSVVERSASSMKAVIEKNRRDVGGKTMPFAVGTSGDTAGSVFVGCVSIGRSKLLVFSIHPGITGHELDRKLVDQFFDHVESIR
ncbi:MAG: hypothetical protein IPM23_11120 [Candidatus Melainabacteria bacterium]|nr:hypothetical protein [Candidatus Melainabacteria bacterium]